MDKYTMSDIYEMFADVLFDVKLRKDQESESD